MSAATFGLNSVGQIFVPVDDLDRATAFYRDVLGAPFLFQAPRMSFFDMGPVRLMLGGPDESSGRASIVYYAVGDIRDAHRILVERGVRFDQGPTLIVEMPDHDLWMAFFKDSEGNQAALMSEVRRA